MRFRYFPSTPHASFFKGHHSRGLWKWSRTAFQPSASINTNKLSIIIHKQPFLKVHFSQNFFIENCFLKAFNSIAAISWSHLCTRCISSSSSHLLSPSSSAASSKSESFIWMENDSQSNLPFGNFYCLLFLLLLLFCVSSFQMLRCTKMFKLF